ncbi:D-alanyl-D-alanine carboxypeptidase, partial [Vibrio anguillarum]|nr:D-alanyl-D-alanine carboxypeptidase [Vibrio anguillarum]
KVIYQVGDRSVGEVPLVALESVDKGSWFKRMIDSLKRLWVSWF